MRREDRIASVLHPETANMLLGAMVATDNRPSINDRDVCLHCRRHQCIAVCPTAALATDGDGRMNFIDARCVGCGACVLSCYEFGNLAWIQVLGGTGEAAGVLD